MGVWVIYKFGSKSTVPSSLIFGSTGKAWRSCSCSLSISLCSIRALEPKRTLASSIHWLPLKVSQHKACLLQQQAAATTATRINHWWAPRYVPSRSPWSHAEGSFEPPSQSIWSGSASWQDPSSCRAWCESHAMDISGDKDCFKACLCSYEMRSRTNAESIKN